MLHDLLFTMVRIARRRSKGKNALRKNLFSPIQNNKQRTFAVAICTLEAQKCAKCGKEWGASEAFAFLKPCPTRKKRPARLLEHFTGRQLHLPKPRNHEDWGGIPGAGAEHATQGKDCAAIVKKCICFAVRRGKVPRGIALNSLSPPPADSKSGGLELGRLLPCAAFVPPQQLLFLGSRSVWRWALKRGVPLLAPLRCLAVYP